VVSDHLSARRVAEKGAVMLRETLKIKQTKMGICPLQTYLPQPPTLQMNQTWQIWMVGDGVGPLICNEEQLQVRLIY
jgi:hypothetical protein